MRSIPMTLLLLGGLCFNVWGQAPAETARPDGDRRVDRLLERADELGDKVSIEYAQKKKEELLAKYPEFEGEYIAFLKDKYPDLESEIVAIFKAHPEALEQYGQLDEAGEPLVNFATMEAMCLNSQECAKSVSQLFKKKYPDFAKETVRYVLDKKPELLVEFAIITLEVLIEERNVRSATGERE